MSTNAEFTELQFAARDQQLLTGRLFISEQAHTVLLINSGTGIPQGFYRRFAMFAKSQGFVVMTYDYRGIGKSAPEHLATSDASYRHWGQLDVPGAIDYLTTRFPNLPLTVVGHSTGGQQLGLAENADKVKAAVFVSVSTGYWKDMFPIRKWSSLFLWKVFIPLTTRLYGYAPARKIGLGENLPKGVALEWGSWCLRPEYLAAYFDDTGYESSVDGKPFGEHHFEKIKFPIKAYCFTDDDIATKPNVPPLMKLFSNAQQHIDWLSPEDLGVKAVGHLGYFRASQQQTLWLQSLTWLQSQTLGNSASG